MIGNEVQWGSIASFGWIWVVGGVAAAGLLATVNRRRAARRFATQDLAERALNARTYRRSLVSLVLTILTMTLLVLCLVDIRWGQVERPVPQHGIEIMFVLDVSRSMLAEDVTPSRLERAKQMISDTVDELAGDRVGLILFAGEVRQHIPMTSHYDDFKQRLELVGPDDLVRGGSRLGDAISVAAEGYLTKTNQHKAMVLLTDGEDMESKPIEAAKRAFDDKGIAIFTIGLGDLETGSRIPTRTRNGRDTFITHDGQQVWSKLNGEILSRVATETGGAYIPAGVKQVNMSDVYHGYISSVEQREFETAKVNGYEARFVWFLVPALALVLTQIFVARD